jgi:hypothetical protein
MSVLAVALTVGCVTPKNVVRIAPEATADSVVFLLRSSTDAGLPAESVYGLSVVRCDTKEVFWTISADGSRLAPDRVVYGQPIPGFPTRAGPAPLVAGCYEVILSGAVPRAFDIGPGRTIRARDTMP